MIVISSQTHTHREKIKYLKKKNRVIAVFRLNDMHKLHFKVWKLLLNYLLTPDILGTHKISQTINNNQPRKIVIIKVITFYLTNC